MSNLTEYSVAYIRTHLAACRVTLTYNLTIAPPFGEPSPVDTQSLSGVQDAEFSKVLEALHPVLSSTDQPRVCFHFEHRYVSRSSISVHVLRAVLTFSFKPVDLNSHAPSTALPIVRLSQLLASHVGTNAILTAKRL